ncbi:MAG TPA: hydrogenase maturation protease [Anaerolineae bacterium]|nr:hydrogenase maturation protease [Anaerolineae bacterium]
MRTLVIGYGNPSRRDDGVARHVVNALRARWGRAALGPLGDGWDDLQGTRDTLSPQQLTPELAETLSAYDLVVFVDATLPAMAGPVRAVPVTPALHMAAVTHHMDPAALLVLAEQLYRRAPVGWLVSVHGHDLGFGDQLSPQTAAALPEAVARVVALVETEQARC